MLAACDALCRRALEVAGKRALTRRDRGRYHDVPADCLHTVLRITHVDIERLLDGAFDGIGWMLDAYGCCGATEDALRATLYRYCADLLLSQRTHASIDLRFSLGLYLGLDTSSV